MGFASLALFQKFGIPLLTDGADMLPVFGFQWNSTAEVPDHLGEIY